jgi:hypothetical protein
LDAPIIVSSANLKPPHISSLWGQLSKSLQANLQMYLRENKIKYGGGYNGAFQEFRVHAMLDARCKKPENSQMARDEPQTLKSDELNVTKIKKLHVTILVLKMML